MAGLTLVIYSQQSTGTYVYSHGVSLSCYPVRAESQLCSYKSNTLYYYQTKDISKGMDPLKKLRGGDNVDVQGPQVRCWLGRRRGIVL